MQSDAPTAETSQSALTVRLWLRADAPSVARDHARALRERLDALPVKTAVERWPSRVTLEEDGTVPRPFERFQRWADGEGVTLELAFRQVSHDCAFTGDHEEVLVTPVCSLSIAREGGLIGVYPHQVGPNDDRQRRAPLA